MRVNLWTALGVSVLLWCDYCFSHDDRHSCATQQSRETGLVRMIGAVGQAGKMMIDPEGKVFVQGELWNAHAASRVGIGEQVIVRKVEGLELEVEKSSN